MTARVESVNVGRAEENPARRNRPTGIRKRPVDGPVEIRDPGPRRGGLGSGLAGDFIGDGTYHGGTDQAVYAFAREELDFWAQELGREIPDGSFGENLTLSGFDVDAAQQPALPEDHHPRAHRHQQEQHGDAAGDRRQRRARRPPRLRAPTGGCRRRRIAQLRPRAGGRDDRPRARERSVARGDFQ